MRCECWCHKEARGEFEILASRHAFVEVLVFGHDSDEWLQALLFGDDIATRDAAAPGARQQPPTQHSNRRGLAGAVVAQEPEYLARVRLRKKYCRPPEGC